MRVKHGDGIAGHTKEGIVIYLLPSFGVRGVDGILVMRRAVLMSKWRWAGKNFDNSEHVKHFGGDDKLGNYGFIAGRLVKIDYGELDDNWGEDFKQHHVKGKI